MNYDLLFFDADDTLLDFKKSETISLQIILEKQGIKENFQELQKNYQKINLELWAEEAQGLISKDYLKLARFEKFVLENNLKVDPLKLSKDYLTELPLHVFVMDEALSLLQSLYKQIPIVIITNGIGVTQHQRLNKSGLETYIDLMVISEECGFGKPNSKIFEYAYQKIDKKRESTRTLMIGDKLETDILGANHLQIDSCWFNPDSLTNTTHIKPNFEIQKLSELKKIIF